MDTNLELEKIGNILRELENLMYGYNYEVIFGIDVYENVSTLYEATQSLKKRYPHSNPDEITPISFTINEVWEYIGSRFDYRGDDGAGLLLNPEQEHKLRKKQDEYKEHVDKIMKGFTEIWMFDFLDGLPRYPVFWEFTFVILTKEHQGILIYGSSSD